jgi:hypothetical protein
MQTLSAREALVKKLDTLTDEQVAALLHVVEAFEPADGSAISEDYDESKGLTIGMFSGAN